MPQYKAEEILVDFETNDDAAVFLVREDLAVVQSVDFFTPIVNDPYLFGQITAANALSDIYAMGAEPSFALSLVAYPCRFGLEILGEIARGGLEKMAEAGTYVIGGHSIEDDEPKYGFAVTGFIRPEEVKRNCTAQEGDLLYATKTIGTGVIATAIKADLISEEDVYDQISQTIRLNKYAKDAALAAEAHALTDITGFGLAGHAYEMAKGSGLAVEIYTSRVLINPKSLELASYGIMPAGLHDNKRYLEGALEVDTSIDKEIIDLMFDPQTSGGLLIAVNPKKAALLEEKLKEFGEVFYLAGRFIREKKSKVILTK
jgi:selenide,water dikinase